jgi:uncharacterized protein YcbK (DUF882 family)
MDRRSWVHRRMLPYLAVGTASLALTVVASADHTDDTVKASTGDDSAPAPEASSPKRPGKSARGPIGYAEMVRRWHLPPAAPAAQSLAARPALVLEMINTGQRLELSPLRDDGGFSEQDLAIASHALRDQRNDEECSIDPRLLDLAYRLERHFQSKAVRVLSAFRVPHGRSNHGRGRALDLVIPGTRDDEVARYARTIGFVGVGFYPRSGFVHVDTRSRSFFWIDASGPGQRGRVVPILPNIAAAADAKARDRGEAPPSDETDGDSDEH